MEAGKYLSYNGAFLPSEEPLVGAANSAFRYGNGFFDTLVLIGNKIVLEEYHFHRWNDSIHKLCFIRDNLWSNERIRDEIVKVAVKNHSSRFVRVRVNFFGGNEPLFSSANKLNFIIETYTLNEDEWQWKEEGISTGIFRNALKIRDRFSHLKTNNYLCYIAAAHYAAINHFDDAILLNESGNIVETCVANIFLIKENKIFTPPLSEGCVEGTMRKYLIRQLRLRGHAIIEKPLSETDIFNAEEVFVSNAVKGLRPIIRCQEKEFSASLCREIFQTIVIPLFSPETTVL